MPTSKKRVLILSFTDHCTDPRVSRQIEALHNDFHLITAGTSEGTHRETEHFQLTKNRHTFVEKMLIAIKLKACFYESAYWGQQAIKIALEKLDTVEVDAIVANDLETLPLAHKLAQDKKIKIYFDAHEYSPKEFDGNFMFDYFLAAYYHYLCKTYLPYIDAMAKKLNNLTVEDLNKFKQNSHKAATIYNAENNAEQLKLILSRLCQ